MSTTTLTPDETAVCATLDGFYAAWAAGDADRVAGHYMRDASVVQPGIYHRSRDEVRTFFTTAFAGRLKDTTVIDESRDVRFPAAGTAIVVSVAGILMAGEASVPPERLVRTTWVLAREDSRWLVAAFQSSPLHVG
jgi:uncharacterized protein (TIGR02246 family)